MSEEAHSSSPDFPGKLLVRLLKAIDRVVEKKELRFSEYAQRPFRVDDDNAFWDLMQPQLQIAQIAQAICEFFNADKSRDDVLVKVTIIALRDGNVIGVLAQLPAEERHLTAMHPLNHANSALQTCIRRRSLILIEDLAEEIKKPREAQRFVDSGRGERTAGSILVYPILYQDNVPLVISVQSDIPQTFREADSSLYQFILERFAVHIRQEYALWLLCDAKQQ